MRDRKFIAKIIIKEFGGTKNTAIHCGLAPSSVSDWKTKGMPKAWIRHFETLRPDLFTDCMDSNDPISDVLTDFTNTPTE
jgi:hypothetical protein